MKSVKIPNFGPPRPSLTSQGLSPIKSSGPEVGHGSNSDTDEGSDEGISRSYGQIPSYGQKKGRYGINNLGHHLGRFAAGRRRVLLYSEGFVETVSTATL